ncbi:SH3 domain-containing protein [Loktanella fryxellensis]|uniref:SH3 domain-containing protein n=1 Tax=Loktanella fryxellensis TaxID=245187 RepID=A0A1H7YKS0_9RHOB|nr:SH3 domain-containing protein [Loktanella fryxellensis]SEM46595.1 SH3 domain-containing protein [Loktanella fryxellensis]
MRTLILMLPLIAAACASSTATGPLGRHEVVAVEADDLLKLRAGPGTGYDVIIGLPNGAVVDVLTCEPAGSTQWCEVRLDQPGGPRGHVSKAYLRKL